MQSLKTASSCCISLLAAFSQRGALCSRVYAPSTHCESSESPSWFNSMGDADGSTSITTDYNMTPY